MAKLYKKAGVDVAKADRLMRAIGSLGEGIGGFAARLDLAEFDFRDPLFLAAADGVGTKILLAKQTGLWDGIGQDLVAMCVNDIVCHGGRPLFFLDYFATAKLDEERALGLISSIAAACKKVGCRLVGGETAELPGAYPPNGCDLAGFAVGAVERERYLDGSNCRAGDVVLGLPAAGAHANGFSLLRKLAEGTPLTEPPPFASPYGTLGEALMSPTALYVEPCLRAAERGGARGFAHITGGGLAANLARIIPAGLCAELTPPPLEGLFKWLAERADEAELRRVFNCGVGMAAVVAPQSLPTTVSALGECVELGRLVEGSDGARVKFA